MKHYFNAVSMGLLAAAVSMALSGCSGGTNTEVTSTTASAGKESRTTGSQEHDSQTKDAKTEDAGKEPITLRFVSWQSHQADANQAVADAYHEKNPNVTVKIDYVGNMNSQDYLTKTDIMMMGGEEMDIIMAPSFMAYSARADSGSYLPLDPYFEEEGSSAEDEFNVIFRVNDKVYGIPAELKYNIVLINKDMLDEAGLPVPDIDWTWDDYRDYARKMTKGTGADTIYGSYFHSWGSMNLYGVGSIKKGSAYFNDDKTLTFDSPYFSDFLQYRYDMENVDKSSTPLADLKALNMSYYDQFFGGKIGMLPMATFMLTDIGNEKYQHDFITTFARMPLWESDDEHYNTASATVFSVSKTSTHPKEAFDFLKFWSTEGVTIKGKFVSNEKGADKMESINRIVEGFTDLVDMDALNNVMQDKKWIDNYEEYIPTYQSQIDSILTEETDKFLLNSQSLEETVNNLMKRSQEVIEENQ